jgi:hypothetical protein
LTIRSFTFDRYPHHEIKIMPEEVATSEDGEEGGVEIRIASRGRDKDLSKMQGNKPFRAR